MAEHNSSHSGRIVKKKITTIILFTAIIIVFAFWGVSSRMDSMLEGGAAAQVNSVLISQAQFLEAVDNVRRNQRDEGDRQDLNERVLQQLVTMELVHQNAEKEGVLVSDSEVRDSIINEPFFQEDGKFKREKYMGFLNAYRKSAADFEESQRTQIAWERMRRYFGVAMKAGALENKKDEELANLKANAEFVKIDADKIVSTDEVKDSEVKDFLAKADNDKKIKEYYDLHKDAYSTSEEVRARHILIRVAGDDKDVEAKALEKAQLVLKKLKAGEDFAKLAGEFSDDPGSKKKGGDLGYFTREKMVPVVSDVVFKLENKALSEPIKSEFGYHILQTMDKKPAMVTTVEQAKPTIAKILLAAERSGTALEGLKGLLTAGDAAAVQKWLTTYKLKWDETGAFSLESSMVPKVGNNDEFARTAFGLTSESPLHKSLIRQGQQAFIVKYKAVPPPAGDSKQPKSPWEKPEFMQEFKANQRVGEIFQRWLTGLQTNAKVIINQDLLGKRK